MRVDRPLLLMLAALTAGCADPEPFVDLGISTSPRIDKPMDPVLENGVLHICFSDQTPWAEVERLAQERCGTRGLQARASSTLRWQCRATSPHRATFQCYDPEMLTAEGVPINPFDPAAVARWEARTGKTAKPHNALSGLSPAPANPAPATPPEPTQAPPAAPAPAALPPVPPAPAQSQAPLRPLTPDDIAGRPAMPPPPQLTPPPGAPAPAPAPGGAYPMDGFTLPQGSWGDHFQE